jgi:hypothetical protein
MSKVLLFIGIASLTFFLDASDREFRTKAGTKAKVAARKVAAREVIATNNIALNKVAMQRKNKVSAISLTTLPQGPVMSAEDRARQVAIDMGFVDTEIVKILVADGKNN